MKEKLFKKKNSLEQDAEKRKHLLEERERLTSKQLNLTPPNNKGRIAQLFSLEKNKLAERIVRRVKNEEIQALQKAITNNNSDHLSFEKLLDNLSDSYVYNELTSINRGALNFLVNLPHQLHFDKFDSMAAESAFEDKISHKRFVALQKNIRLFFKKELSWIGSHKSVDMGDGKQLKFSGTWKLDNREFDYDKLSEGEKILFAYALLFFLLDQNQNLNITACILIIDEPELHLHPDPEIDLIERLKEIVGKHGQLIFATHSLNILSHLNYDEVFLVKDNAIEKKNSQTPPKSLSELMQIENRILKLSEFLDSIDSWTYVNFMVENFLNPEVIESSSPDDPQIQALRKALLDNIGTNNLLLDFGAGKGRLIEHLITHDQFSTSIQFHALEPQPDFHSRLIELGVETIYKDYLDLPKKQFKFIVLSNVLHEIPLADWIETLNSCINSLVDDGFLIIIEAKRLNKGEKIGNTGFLLLGLEELQVLFDSQTVLSSIKNNEDKIVCCVLNKQQIAQVTNDNLKNCLISLAKNSLQKLEKHRQIEYDKSQLSVIGRESAFLSQQYINATIALKSLGIKQLKF